MYKHPRHFTAELSPAKEYVTIKGRYNPYTIDSEFSYILCSCGGRKFSIYLSELPEVKCICANCSTEYLAYDASQYPGTTYTNPGKGDYSKWISETGRDVFHIIVLWLYPDNPDTRDDVDWFVLIAKEPGSDTYTEVVSHETI